MASCTSILLVGVILVARFPSTISQSVSLSDSGPVYQGGIAGFSATAPVLTTITAIRWTLNGIPLSELSDVTADPLMLNQQTVNLIIRNVTATYNEYTVSCTTVLSSGNNVTCSPAATIQVQGFLGPAENLTQQSSLMDQTVIISWTAPPAITVTPATAPERFYCVEMSNGTTTESRGCNRNTDMNEETSIMLSNIKCGVTYDITITPFNRVGDGTVNSAIVPGPPKIKDSATTPQKLNETNYIFTFVSSDLVCSCNAVKSQNSLLGTYSCELNTSSPGVLTVTAMDALPDLRFDILIIANSSSRVSSSEAFQISTNDISDLKILTTTSEVDYSVTFADGSNALGVFMLLFFRTNGRTNYSQSVYFVQGRRGAINANQLTGIAAGTYIVHSYNLEASGEIFNDRPADEEQITVTGQNNSDLTFLTSFGSDISCTSERRFEDTMAVTCNFDTGIYNGFRVFEQEDQDTQLYSIGDLVSGSSVDIIETDNRDHYIFVYPIWKPGSVISDNKMRPVYQVIFNPSKPSETTQGSATTTDDGPKVSSPVPSSTTKNAGVSMVSRSSIAICWVCLLLQGLLRVLQIA